MTKCVVCGCEYEPKRKNQPCCEGCKSKWRMIYTKQYASWNRPIKGVSKQVYKREKARQYRARAKGEVYVPKFYLQSLKEEPIHEGMTYAEKQRLKTLAMVGKVEI